MKQSVLAGFLLVLAVSGGSGITVGSDPLAELVAIDRSFGLTTTAPAARAEFDLRLGNCAPTDVTCQLRALFGGETLRPNHRATSALENTVSYALRTGEGPCVVLAAIALGLTENIGRPFDAVILHDHVLLTPTGVSDVYFELLDLGRRLGRQELVTRHGEPVSEAVRVHGFDAFVPYYLDNLAARLAAEGRHEAAERAFAEALARGPRAARLHYNHGTWLVQQERWLEADKALSRAIRLGWRDADTFVNRGVARWRLGRLRSAAKDFRKALDLEPGDRRAQDNLAALHRESQPRPAER